MGSKRQKNNKIKRINVRLTELEWVDLEREMRRSGYLSKSKFIRESIFSIRRRSVRGIKLSENTSQNLIELISNVKKIGVNYNQVVKTYNSVKERASSYHSEITLKKLYQLTDVLVKNVIALKEKLNEN